MTDPHLPDIYVSGRREGKTNKSILWLAGGQKVDVCPGLSRMLLTFNEREADRLRREYPVFDEQILSLSSWQRSRRGRHHELEIGIDNADMVLQDLVGPYRLSFVTLSGRPTG